MEKKIINLILILKKRSSHKMFKIYKGLVKISLKIKKEEYWQMEFKKDLCLIEFNSISNKSNRNLKRKSIWLEVFQKETKY
jgi:hypothetical protein